MFSRQRWRAARWVTGLAATAVVTAGIAAPQAAAAPGGTIVVLGDSFAANTADVLSSGCPQSRTSWPQQLARTARADVIQAACLGASLTGGYNINDEARVAQRKGGFTAGTTAVLVQMGFNEWIGTSFHTRCLFAGCAADDPALRGVTAENYAARVRGVVEYAKYYAPNAKIALVGYPEIHRPGARAACATVVGGAQVRHPAGAGMVEATRRLQAAQQGAAQLLGVAFVDAQAATRGHGLCTRDPWVNGVLHPSLDPMDTVMFAHPTEKGDAVLAGTIRRQLGL